MGEGTESGPEILLVEDNPGDVRLVEESLRGTPSTLYVTRDGREALDFLYRRGEFTDAPRPNIVLLDLNLPQVDGARVLEEIRNEPELERTRVAIVTSTRTEYADLEPNDLTDFEEDNFHTKPTDPDEFMALVRSIVFG